MLNDLVLLSQYQRFNVAVKVTCSISAALSDPISEGPPQEVYWRGGAWAHLSKQRPIMEPAKIMDLWLSNDAETNLKVRQVLNFVLKRVMFVM